MDDLTGNGRLRGVEEDRVTDSAMVGDDLGADSLDLVELVMCVEDELGVDIPDDALDGSREDLSVAEVKNVVAKYALA